MVKTGCGTSVDRAPMSAEESAYIKRFGEVLDDMGYMTKNVEKVYDVNGNLAGFEGLDLPKSKSWLMAVLYSMDHGGVAVSIIAGGRSE